MAGANKLERLTTHPGSDLRQLQIQHNNLVTDAGVQVPLFVGTTSTANTSTTETVLQTYSLAANQVDQTGDGVFVNFWGHTTNNADAKTLKVYFGASNAIATLTMTASIAGVFQGEMWVFRTGANAQVVALTVSEGTTSLAAGKVALVSTTASQTETAAIVVKVTGTSGTGSNDIYCDGMTVQFVPAAADLVASKLANREGTVLSSANY